MRRCLDCKVSVVGTHFNVKRCFFCAEARRQAPLTNLTDDQKEKAKKLAGTMFKKDVAREVGCSWSALSRFTKESKVSFNHLKTKPEVIKKVCEYYEKHGKAKTQKKFPKLKIRSIVERYYYGKYNARQTSWTDEQIIELTKMAGIVSMTDQAKYFKRPGANKGSIRSAWMKKFRVSGGMIHGFPHYKAINFVSDDCPFLTVPFWSQRKHNKICNKKLYLWCDMSEHLLGDSPVFIKDSFDALARFQYWIYGSNPREQIVKIIQDRTL